MEGEAASDSSGGGGESGSGGVSRDTGTDSMGNQTVNIGYGVYVPAGNSAISVSGSGDSSGSKENGKNAKTENSDPIKGEKTSKESSKEGENKSEKSSDGKDKEPDQKNPGRQHQSKDPYVQNNTKNTIYFKSEEGSDKIALKPGERTNEKVDGIRVGNTVIEVTDGYTKVVVKKNGTVNIYYPEPVSGAIYHIMGGGKLSSPPGTNWWPLFDVIGKDAKWNP